MPHEKVGVRERALESTGPLYRTRALQPYFQRFRARNLRANINNNNRVYFLPDHIMCVHDAPIGEERGQENVTPHLFFFFTLS